MRLFFGLNISEDNRNQLNLLQDSLISNGRKVNKNNLHITLAFLGEVNEKEYMEIKNIMKNFSYESFNVSITKIKMMRDMVIAEVENNNHLNHLQLNLTNYLSELGFVLEKRKYYPHITLSRKSNLNILKEINIIEKIEEVILFESKFLDTGVKYFQKEKWKLN